MIIMKSQNISNLECANWLKQVLWTLVDIFGKEAIGESGFPMQAKVSLEEC